MKNSEELEPNEKEIQIISKKMIAIALIAPFSLGILGIIIGFVITLHKTETIRRIALVAGAFIGLLISVILIFALQGIINKRLKSLEEKEEERDIVEE